MTARDRTVLLVVLAVSALAAGWLLVVQPKRATAAKLGNSVISAQTRLATLKAQVAADGQARAAFPVDYAELAQLGKAVPPDDNVPSLIWELQSTAKASGVNFRGLRVTPSGSSSPSTTASSSSASALVPGVSIGSAQFGAEQFGFTFSGNFFNLSDFLGRLDRFVIANGSVVRVRGRLMTLNALTLAAASQGAAGMVATVSATTYVLPASQGLLDGASAAGPTSAAAGSTATGTGSAPAPGPAGGAGTTPARAAAISAPAIMGGAR